MIKIGKISSNICIVLLATRRFPFETHITLKMEKTAGAILRCAM